MQFSWNDIIADYEETAYPGNLLSNFPKYLAFFADGTVFKYLRASPRYFGFTIYPLLFIAVFAWFSWLAASILGGPLFVTLPIALAILLVIFRRPGDRFYLNLSINDWAFARDMVNGVNPKIEARYQEFSEVLAREIMLGKHDEVLIVGHSFGAVWAAMALSKALEENEDLIQEVPVSFLALGSSIPKIGLARKAGFMRKAIARIMSEQYVFWHEIQTKNDIIAFYKSDPFEQMGITNMVAPYAIDRVNYKEAMDETRYKTMKRSFYKTHRQYILYQDKRVHFDFMLRCFGPLNSRALALNKTLWQAIDKDGVLRTDDE
ncbi:MAG: hypothetical protein JKY83_06820 [Rhizobiaceae bacterium]|nr:hypothetical protein [Rhizobiaceae bacterium]